MMTLIAGLMCTWALLLAVFLGDLGSASSARMRAQAAADAAALAAVAEGTSYGDSDPRRVATTYAEANGGTLISCDCDPFTSDVRLVVEVDGVEASARAQLDPELLGAGVTTSGVNDLNPDLKDAVQKLIAASGGAVTLNSGFRSLAEQEVLWQQALAKYGDPEIADNWVARPGDSFHGSGLAVDFGGDVELAAELVGELGLPLWRPMFWEPWHFELEGSRG